MAQNGSLPPGLTPDQVRKQLDRVLGSEMFRRSDRLSRFLKYVISAGVAGDDSKVKEYTIGREVFDKAKNFDPRADPIVRVEAGRLRAKLREYYATVGKADTLFVGIRDRGYTPLIRFVEPASRDDGRPSAADGSKRFIAVLTIRDLSPRRTHDPFCEGLTHEIQTRLIQDPPLPGLNVIGRPLARLLHADSEDFLTTAKQLGVEQVLEGSVQRIDGKVRLNAELTNVQTGQSLWAQSIDRALDDVFLLQREFADETMAGLRRIRRPADSAQRHEKDGKGSTWSDGYAHHVRGKTAWSSGAIKNLPVSIESFERATEANPQFADAWAGLANSRAALALSRRTAPGQLMRQAKAAAERAIELQSDLAEAHAAKGLVEALCEFNWKRAEASFQRARAADPRLPLTDQWHALGLLLPQGHLEEAHKRIGQAQHAEPTSILLHYYRGVVEYFRGRFEAASKIFEVVVELEPEYEAVHLTLGDCCCQLGMDERALECYQRVIDLEEENAQCGSAAISYLQAIRGRERGATAIVDGLVPPTGHGHSWPYEVATVYAALGQAEAAFEWLERAREDGVPQVAWIQFDPKFAMLRGDPRFGRFLRTMGLRPPRKS